MKINNYEESTTLARKLLLLLGFLVGMSILLILNGCNEDDPEPNSTPDLTGTSITYTLESTSGSNVGGTVTFSETAPGSTIISFDISGGTSGEMHPVHIHANSTAEGGGIVISLGEIDGSTGDLSVEITETDDGTTVSYNDLINFDGHINIHASPADLATIVATTDIGANELTGEQEDYDLYGKLNPELSGEVLIQERKSGEILVTLKLEGNGGSEDHPAHIHNDNSVDGGGIVISLNPVDAETGMSFTQIAETDEGDLITYNELKEFDGHVNVHLSSAELSTVILQGDIGQNELTSDTEEYDLGSLTDANISGSAVFTRRRNNETLVEINLENTSETGNHPAHIHSNTAVEGGGVIIPLTNVNGETGKSLTNISQLVNETPITYEELMEFDGHINIHLSASEISTIVAQGDVGQNALTGESQTYDLTGISNPGVSGDVTFYERKNETILIIIELIGTTAGNTHPAHIHANDKGSGGVIILDLTSVDGATGLSKTQVEMLNDGTEVTYDDLIDLDGHVNVHASPDNLATILANGNIGANAE